MIVALWVSVRNLIPTQVLHGSENVSLSPQITSEDYLASWPMKIGHHVQKLLGIDGEVQAVRQQNRQEANQLSVRLELPADCFAGVWGHSTQQHNILEAGDVDADLKAAAAVRGRSFATHVQRVGESREFHPRKLCPAHGVLSARVSGWDDYFVQYVPVMGWSVFP